MSNSIIRKSRPAAAKVYIGERHEETRMEAEAEKVLREFFPFISFVTTPDGAKLIPISQIHKFTEYLDEERQRAREAGRKEGYDTGVQDGLKDAKRVVGQFEQAVKDAIGQRQALLEEAREQALKLAVQVARKVTFDAIDVDSEITLKMISRVIEQLVDRSRLKIKVHPNFLPIVEQELDRFLGGSTAIKDLTVEGDPRVKHGGCFIETPSGDIDARIDSQFEVVEEAIHASGEVS